MYNQEDINNILIKYTLTDKYLNYSFIDIIKIFDNIDNFLIYSTFKKLDNFIFPSKTSTLTLINNIQKKCKKIYNINNDINDIFKSDFYKSIKYLYNMFINVNNSLDINYFYNISDEYKNNILKLLF